MTSSLTGIQSSAIQISIFPLLITAVLVYLIMQNIWKNDTCKVGAIKLCSGP